jgi:hypothetical protein
MKLTIPVQICLQLNQVDNNVFEILYLPDSENISGEILFRQYLGVHRLGGRKLEYGCSGLATQEG